MHSFLIVSNSTDETEKKVVELTQKLSAEPFVFPLIKIADVREIINFTKISLSSPTAIIIQQIDQSSFEAQNAFLKSLEEPQENLYYILTTSTIDAVLPTIISRCEVIEITIQEKITEEAINKTQEFIDLSVGKKLQIISKITKREEAIQFMTDLIKASHALLLRDPSLVNFVEKAQQTLAAFSANGNIQLQLTNFVINI